MNRLCSKTPRAQPSCVIICLFDCIIAVVVEIFVSCAIFCIFLVFVSCSSSCSQCFSTVSLCSSVLPLPLTPVPCCHFVQVFSLYSSAPVHLFSLSSFTRRPSLCLLQPQQLFSWSKPSVLFGFFASVCIFGPTLSPNLTSCQNIIPPWLYGFRIVSFKYWMNFI